jgi:hypothetical protein
MKSVASKSQRHEKIQNLTTLFLCDRRRLHQIDQRSTNKANIQQRPLDPSVEIEGEAAAAAAQAHQTLDRRSPPRGRWVSNTASEETTAAAALAATKI